MIGCPARGNCVGSGVASGVPAGTTNAGIDAGFSEFIQPDPYAAYPPPIVRSNRTTAAQRANPGPIRFRGDDPCRDAGRASVRPFKAGNGIGDWGNESVP